MIAPSSLSRLRSERGLCRRNRSPGGRFGTGANPPPSLKCPTTAAAHPPTGRASGHPAPSAPSTARGAPAGGQDGLFGALPEGRDRTVVPGEREALPAFEPARLVHHEAVPVEDPTLRHAQSHGPGKPSVQRVRRQALEPVLLGALEELLEAPDPDQRLR